MKILSFSAYPHKPGRVQTVTIGPILSLTITDVRRGRYDYRINDPRTGKAIGEIKNNSLAEIIFLIAVAQLTYNRLKQDYADSFSYN